jgi:hypothetical protein
MAGVGEPAAGPALDQGTAALTAMAAPRVAVLVGAHAS